MDSDNDSTTTPELTVLSVIQEALNGLNRFNWPPERLIDYETDIDRALLVGKHP